MPLIEDRFTNYQVTRHLAAHLGIVSFIGKLLQNYQEMFLYHLHLHLHLSKLWTILDKKIVVGSCHICYKGQFKKRRKTRKSCVECTKPVCDEHAKTFTKCIECYNETK